MSKNDELFDQAVAAIRDESIDPRTEGAALERVRRRLAAELAPLAEDDATAGEHRIRGCAGFQVLIPAYLAGALTEPRRILFEDHTRECVPCRRALAEARRGGAARPTPGRLGHRAPAVRWLVAAGLAGVAIAGAALLAGRLGLVGPTVTARVRAIDGELQAVENGHLRTLAAGATVGRGVTLRTAGGSDAVLELADGSRVELGERAELALARRRDGAVLDLGRGALIVEAAHQKHGHLYVRTDDCLVSVVGTIFSVNTGVRGSRVSVLDGEVRVHQGAHLAVLRPGEQLATTARLERVSLTREVSWSRNATEYDARIAALRALGHELDQALATPGDRTSTRLLDLAPSDTVIWAGLPNVSGKLADAWSLLERRVAESPVLSVWWHEHLGSADAEREMADAVARLHDLGSHLGPEIGVAVGLDATGKVTPPLLMAEVKDGSAFDAVLDDEIARLNAQSTEGEVIRRIDDPASAADSHALLVWRPTSDLIVASPSAERLRRLAGALSGGAGPYLRAAFRDRLASTYAGGTGWLLGVDAASIFAHAHSAPNDARAFHLLGIDGADQLILESESTGGETISRATLAFSGARRGMASWLAQPAPSGALEFVSPDASFAVAGLVKQPSAMVDDLLTMARASGDNTKVLSHLADLESKLGFSLRDDLAASLGGDFAFAFDGPWLPKPSWKLVAEVVDPSRVQFVLSRAVDVANTEAAQEGKPGLRFGQEEVDGRVYLHLARENGTDLAYLSFVDGYLIAAPSRALIAEAIARRAAGASLATSRAFLDRLPRDADPNFSALVWQNFGSSIGDLGHWLAGVGTPQQAISQLAAEAGPSLLVAYGEPGQVRLVAQGQHGPLGLSLEKLFAIGGAFGGPQPATPAPSASAARPVDETPVHATT